MALWNLGSVNVDHVYRTPRIPAPGETLAASGYRAGLGGKGANQSVAAARAGARVHHIGAIGPDGGWTRTALRDYGVDTAHLADVGEPTGHAIIAVDDAGENAILIWPGANRSPDAALVGAALAGAAAGDSLLLQNETSAQAEAAQAARRRGLSVIYSAAPFDPAAVRAVVDHVTLLVMNAGEAAELAAAMGALPPVDCLITRGASGADWIAPGTEPLHQPAFRVTPVDTTGAGDTFTGWLAAELDLGLSRPQAMQRAAAAAAIQVTRPGAAPAIPTAAEVTAFLAARPA
ncbi:MAG: ribokinase [Paracoccaceae bacterium]|nr:MAG: ribokinase [Paracoccaceae bacterium]